VRACVCVCVCVHLQAERVPAAVGDPKLRVGDLPGLTVQYHGGGRQRALSRSSEGDRGVLLRGVPVVHQRQLALTHQ